MKKTLSISLLLFIVSFSNLRAQEPVAVVKASLEAYNNRDIDLFMSYFSEDVSMYNFNNGHMSAEGTDQVRAIFKGFFEASPNLHSRIVDRITFDNKVIDHESITGANGNKEAFEVVVIYEIKDDKIIKMTAVRKEN